MSTYFRTERLTMIVGRYKIVPGYFHGFVPHGIAGCLYIIFHFSQKIVGTETWREMELHVPLSS